MGSILLAILFFYLIIENLYLRFELDLLKVDNITRWSERWEAIAAAGKFERQMKYWKYRCLARERWESPMRRRKKDVDGD